MDRPVTISLRIKSFRQQVLLDLSQRGARKFLQGNELSGHLERCQFLAATFFHRGGLKLPASDYVSYRHFAPDPVRYADNRRFGHPFLLLKELFNFARIDVEPAGDDQVAAPSEESVVAVGR